MEYNNEKETEEGIVNKIPLSINISNKFLGDKSSPYSHLRKKSLTISTLDIANILPENEYSDNSILNTVRVEKYKYNLKFEDSNSTATKSSINDKIKKVTFSTVEIIRVANYKAYNKLNTIRKNDNIPWANYNNCLIF